MAEQIDPNVALEKVSKAIRAGQKEYDKLPQEVKDAAKVAAEGSLGSDDEYSPTEPIEREDYNPIPSFGREKAADAPLFQDLKTGEDFARLGLEAASMSPIGQAAQAGADVGIAGMDIAAGDYTGAAISGAAVLLPFVSAGVLKSLMKHAPDRTKALEDAFTAGDLSEDALKEELKQLQLSTIGLPLDELDPSKANKPLRSVIERQQRNLRGTRAESVLLPFVSARTLNALRKLMPDKTKALEDAAKAGDLSDPDNFRHRQPELMRSVRELGEAARRIEYPTDFSPKFGLEDTGGLKFGMRKAGEPVQQLGPLTEGDRSILKKLGTGHPLPGGKTYDEMSDIELRELRDEYVAYGYDDFESPYGGPLGWGQGRERVPYNPGGKAKPRK